MMLVGLPGSGKSTFIRNLVEQGIEYTVASTDNYIEERATEEGISYDEAFSKHIKAASKNMNKIIQSAVANRVPLIWDQTNLTPKSRKKKLKMIPADIYYRKAVYFDIPDDVLVKRLKMRGEAEGKNIPFHVMERMKESFIAPTREEGFDTIEKITR